MNVSKALSERKSVRAFLNKAVERELIETILNNASHAPSGTNTQPWQVAVVSGQNKIDLQQKLEAEFRSGNKGKMDYQYYPLEWDSPYKDRRRACGLQMYTTLDIQREDKQKQLDQWAKNYRAFDAPVMLFFFIDPVMEKGSYLDYGMFLQSVMLAAVEQGLATCPQAALAEYPEIVKQQLGYAEDSVLICGMALGYEDKDALVNSYRTPREPAASFTRFFD
ncbi:MAG: nitroreductase [Gammaproteobacteria bacterium]|nr:nitroreductase [Gammaproteobacteria bacterium]